MRYGAPQQVAARQVNNPSRTVKDHAAIKVRPSDKRKAIRFVHMLNHRPSLPNNVQRRADRCRERVPMKLTRVPLWMKRLDQTTHIRVQRQQSR
jgi:hypothetical protein